ncbi:MAG TPA: reverse transcriptase domain-containing protein [Candidatus Paceibacterota bacterium]|nr:reverse transcriptase domain-containing protein [Candidatus Paceibacterota bacterium]
MTSHTENNMIVDTELGVATGSTNTPHLQSSQPLPLNSESTPTSSFGRYAELPPTRAMKTFCKNLVSKYTRLQSRLLQYTDMKDGADIDNGIITNPDKLKKIKKLYQFRLVDIPRLRKTTLAAMESTIAYHVVNGLGRDVQEELDQAKDTLAAAPNKLKAELEGCAQSAMSGSLLSEEDKRNLYEEWWKHQITYNVRQLEQFLIKCKAGATSAVSDLLDWLINELKSIFNNSFDLSVGSRPAKGKGHDPREPEPSQKKGPSQRRRQKRRQKKNKREGIREEQGEGQSSGPRSQTSISKQKVFVNVHSDKNIVIPNIVFRTLNLGANFQLASVPSQTSIWRHWENTKGQIQARATRYYQEKQGQTNQKINSSLINVIDAVNDRRIYNLNYINKALQNKGLRKAANINSTLQVVYDFLVKNDLYVILADKNLGLTIVDKEWYHIHMRKYFDNTDAFQICSEWFDGNPSGEPRLGRTTYMPHLTVAENTLRNCVKRYNKTEGFVYNFMEKYFDWKNHVVPQAYGLIKLHKEPRKLRYITPVVNWINVPVAKMIVEFLQPYLLDVPWVLQSSMQLVPELESISNRTIWIGSWDVSDMYNQIDQDESLWVLKMLAMEKGWWTSANEAKWNFYLDLLDWVYSTSYVSYNNEVYKQAKGLPMGSPLSPVIANLFMASIEYILFEAFKAKCITFDYVRYFRYLDDIIMIQEFEVAEDPEILKDFHPAEILATEFLSQISMFATDSNLNFENAGRAIELGDSIEYLDLKISIARKYNNSDVQCLKVSVFDKPTNLHIYTDPSTFYPIHYVYNWIQGENIRYIRNSSDARSYHKSLKLFKQFLFRRKYLETKVDRFLALNTFEDRDELLRGLKPHQTRKGKGKTTKKNTYIMIENSGARDIITRAVKTIDNVASTTEDFGLRLIPTVRRGKSILTVMNKTRKN